MSRCYRNETVLELSRKVTAQDRKIATAAYSDEWKYEDCDVTDDEIALWGENSLCGGEREEEAHERITKRMRQALPGCRVTTRWTYLEELPYEEYVSEPKEEPERPLGGRGRDRPAAARTREVGGDANVPV